MYHIRTVLQQEGVSLNTLRERMEQKLSKTALHDILANGKFPKRQNIAALKNEIIRAARAAGIHQSQLKQAWQRAKTQSQSTQPTRPSLSTDDEIIRRRTMISQEIQKHLGLNRDPFDGEIESAADVMNTKPHQRVLSRMLEAAKNCKFLAVVGQVGSGKSIVKTLFTEELKRKQNYLISEPEIISKEKCLPSNLINAMVDDFLYSSSRTGNMKNVNARRGDLEEKSRWVHALLRLKVSDGKKLVLLIDESHGLREETLRSLKRFHELQDGFKKLLSIILIGQDELLENLTGNYALREVSARVNIIEMKAIPTLIEDYVDHKLTRAGADVKKIMDDSALKTIKRLLPKAVPLSINNLLSRSIEEGYNLGTFPITGEVVESAYRSFKVVMA